MQPASLARTHLLKRQKTYCMSASYVDLYYGYVHRMKREPTGTNRQTVSVCPLWGTDRPTTVACVSVVHFLLSTCHPISVPPRHLYSVSASHQTFNHVFVSVCAILVPSSHLHFVSSSHPTSNHVVLYVLCNSGSLGSPESGFLQTPDFKPCLLYISCLFLVARWAGSCLLWPSSYGTDVSLLN
jgi:hypothetical protein